MKAHERAEAWRLRRLLRAGFVVASFAAIVLLLWSQGDAITAAARRFDGEAAVLALGAALGHVLMSYWAWRVLRPGGSERLSARQARSLFFLSQVGKYLPGGIWQFIAAAELGKEAGIGRRETMASFVFALVAAIAAGATLAIARLAEQLDQSGLGPWWFAAALLPLAVLLFPPMARLIARVAGIARVPPPRTLAVSALLAIGTWFFAGAMLASLASALGYDGSVSSIVLYSAYYAAAWIAGFLVLIAPAGIGAREGVLIALLSAQMPLAEAALVALMARIFVTIVDLGAAAFVLAFNRPPAAREA